jgi:tripartite-type tricarboxylate transporter receptor subunit TctC
MQRLAARLLTVALLVGCLAASAAAADLTIVIAYGAGGASDLTARVIQPELSKILNTQVIIKNVPGAAGTIGATEVARAKPDGNTLLLTPLGPMTIFPQLRKIGYTHESFTPVCKVYDSPLIMMTAKNSGIMTVKDLVEAAKASPGQFPYASTGAGTIPHLSMLALGKAAGVQMKHVPFKGSAEVMQSLLANTVKAFSDQTNLIKQYDLHPLAVFKPERIKEFPDTPTVKEAGYDLSYSIWGGFYAPAGLPKDVLARLDGACQKVLTSKPVVEGLARMQMPIDYLPHDALDRFTRSEIEKNKKLIEESGLKQQ